MHAGTRLLIGPLNTAGQGSAWASSARTALPAVEALSMSVQGRGAAPVMDFDSDIHLTQAMQLHGLRVWRARVLGLDDGPAVSHALCESGRPVLRDFHTGSFTDDLDALTSVGARVGVLFHGSDIRLPSQHAEMYPHSPFRHGDDDYTSRLEQSATERLRALADFTGQIFVSTPDLLDFVPQATWLPLSVDVAAFSGPACRQRPALDREVPVVVHAPSRPRLKGTASIEDALSELSDRGLIEYRRLTGRSHREMAGFIAAADIVVDQVVLGNPGALSVESMAAGRLVLAHLSFEVRERMSAAEPDLDGPPIVEATPDTLATVVEQACAERPTYQRIAQQGPGWARRNHDDRASAAVLAPWLRA